MDRERGRSRSRERSDRYRQDDRYRQHDDERPRHYEDDRDRYRRPEDSYQERPSSHQDRPIPRHDDAPQDRYRRNHEEDRERYGRDNYDDGKQYQQRRRRSPFRNDRYPPREDMREGGRQYDDRRPFHHNNFRNEDFRRDGRRRNNAEKSFMSPESNNRHHWHNPDISSSRERSRFRERKRRRAQARCIAEMNNSGGNRDRNAESKMPNAVVWDGFQWIKKDTMNMMPTDLRNDPLAMQHSRKARRLYVGNIPMYIANVTEDNLQQEFYNVMKARGMCRNPDINPIMSVWFARDKGNYGFIELASPEEAEHALTLDGVMMFGVNIKVSRTNDYYSGAPIAGSAAYNAAVSATAAGTLM